jgi:uracil-DNA glycosylase family 4
MSNQPLAPDRAILLASLRDYLEQLREEGIDGLPAENPSAMLTSAQMAEVAASAAKKPPGMAESPDQGKRTAKHDERADQSGSLPASATATTIEFSYRYPDLEKTRDLEMLRDYIGACTRCKLAPLRTNLVFGVGNPSAELMFVGEAPGADEDLQGEPFVGRAGQLLTDIIERGMGISRSDVYICNVIKCRPPENRNPEADEVSTCEPFLFRQIDLVRPKAIVGLGTFAVQALLKVKTPIGKLRGKWHEVRGIKMMPTFHPAYLLRNPADKRLVWADIQEVMKFLGQSMPPRGSRR